MQQGKCFSFLFSCNFHYSLATLMSNWVKKVCRFTSLCICWATPSEKAGLWLLPKVSSALTIIWLSIAKRYRETQSTHCISINFKFLWVEIASEAPETNRSRAPETTPQPDVYSHKVSCILSRQVIVTHSRKPFWQDRVYLASESFLLILGCTLSYPSVPLNSMIRGWVYWHAFPLME